METMLDYRQILNTIKKNLWLLITLPLIFGILVFAGTHFLIKPKYESSTQIIVNQKEKDDQMLAQQLQSDLQLVNTYSEIIRSPRIMDEVSKDLKNKYSGSQLSSMTTIESAAQSQILKIKVITHNEKDSKIIANKVANTFKKEIDNIMKVDNVSVLSKAGNGVKIYPKPMTNTLLGALIGLVIAIFIAAARELFDKRIKDEEDVEKILDLPVLGAINRF
ncbi:Wzz/FepE/Etk N-terminal domain-containing protein [Staphylococcus debuckii]|uniref:Wzz/FepE/Etk N-terminal domain-containing protein n=1 Tax=Staphylococcus debuckii TaxID=2044912 RepID=UPI000F433360|nr:Wzz/FepE/Etk N-terminal domain-containing protein [Staphylococcus debuckii]AYU56115.1 capsule biosynthesis protein CapA [Staphylococcus debuckii]